MLLYWVTYSILIELSKDLSDTARSWRCPLESQLNHHGKDSDQIDLPLETASQIPTKWRGQRTTLRLPRVSGKRLTYGRGQCSSVLNSLRSTSILVISYKCFFHKKILVEIFVISLMSLVFKFTGWAQQNVADGECKVFTFPRAFVSGILLSSQRGKCVVFLSRHFLSLVWRLVLHKEKR